MIRGIPAMLQNGGRRANNDLAGKARLPPSPPPQCYRPRAAIENGGVITGYRTTLSSDALGPAAILAETAEELVRTALADQPE
jgi:DNA-binding Lrp family transcriptional regulator